MFHPLIIEQWPGKSYWRCKGTLRGCGKKLSSRRIVLVVKMVIFEKCQKVFDNGLVQQMISNCHETPQGEMAHTIRDFHKF